MIFNGSMFTRDDLPFQKKKVGSIRDNPKLLKIRERFENASQNLPDLHNVHSGSTTSLSCTLPRGSNASVLEELVKCSAINGSEALMKALNSRRRSEGDVGAKSSFSVYSSELLSKSTRGSKVNDQNVSKTESVSSICSKYPMLNQKNAKTTSDCGANYKPCTKTDILLDAQPYKKETVVSNLIVDDVEPPAPPIPRRGISPAVRNSVMNHLSLCSSQSNNAEPPEQAPNRAKCSPVKKAIQMYEGMSSGEVRKAKLPKGTTQRPSPKKESVSRHSSVVRRASRRNSLRKTKQSNDSSKSTLILKNLDGEESLAKEDSGLGSSDAEDKSQSIYQTLSSVVRDRDDPYDRLNRVHDFVSRVHKGQISTCAACKALPPSIAQLPQEESSVRRVKCNEVTPHHHPPCICFSCSHSVFSCSLEQSSIEEDALYSNVCCLNFPDRGDQWRQSRRRPVCERNGRVCVVNCDMEQKHLEAHYDRLCEWNSKPKECREDKSLLLKSNLGDSCDSDEGWVDITDSEDEKSASKDYRFLDLDSQENQESGKLNTLNTYLSAHNTSYEIDCIISKCANIEISRCSSAEHLYESIADIESQNATRSTNEDLDSSKESKLLSHKDDPGSENELDSGEWSTESASPVFDESSVKDDVHVEKASQNPYIVNMKDQETAKTNFMKSVLGKKAPNAKRRMSNFFVPWLVVNECSATVSPSRGHKKKNGCYPVQNKIVPAKAKRSQSTSTNSPKIGLSRVKAVSSPSCLEKGKNKSVKSDCNSNILDTLCFSADFSGRTSIASSTYLRADDLEKPRSVVSSISPSSHDGKTIEVNIEHVRHRSLSGTSDHSYILFQPVKEEDVPLYQFFERNMKERVSLCCSPSNFSPLSSSFTTETGTPDSGMRPQLSVVEQLSPDAKDMKMLWCELPEVKESGILERISAQELKLQEAAFEFIQSQASFIRSLKVLYENFIKAPEFSDQDSSSCVLSKHEHDVLFSDILRVKEVGENLLCDLTTRWSEGILIPDICDIIFHHVRLTSFSIYIRYCSNRMYQERTLKELKETRLCFLDVLRKLESNPACQGLSLESFLFLPMQHIARLPLLLDNIFRWLSPESSPFSTCKTALEAVHKTFMECNEGARKMERLEEMFILNKQLEFKECKALPLISASRWLLKKGELVKIEFDKKTFGRSSRCVRVPVYLFLFNDFLVITKKKSEESYQVVDYCPREKVQAMAVNARDLQYPVVVPNTCRYLVYLTLFQNHQGGAVDMIISCTLLSERTRWIEAIHTVPENKPCEIWEYDCPQVQCVRTYIAQQPDELSLQESDVVTVHRKMNDGWYEGRRLRDGMQGWFPASYTMDIPCSRARASNLRQCYRLLMLSHNKQ